MPEGQSKRRLHLRIPANSAKRNWDDGGVDIAFVFGVFATGPQHHGAFAAQVAEIDPRRPARIAIDQDAGLLARVMADVPALPHRPDHIGQWMAGCRPKPTRKLVSEAVAGKKGGTIALIDQREERIVCNKCEREDREYDASDCRNAQKSRRVNRGWNLKHHP